ncbi:MAG: MFS transporter [Acidimicrobiales bacterium]|jgi:MFS family permease
MSTSLVARLPLAMAGLAIVLRVSRATGSYSEAGAITAVYVAACAIGSPVWGRLADRSGRRLILVITALASAVGLLALSAVPVHHTWEMVGVAFVAGAGEPPVSAAVRSLWPRLAQGGNSDALYAIDSTLQELTFVAGPALVAVLVTLSGTAAPLVASALFSLVGTLSVAFHPAVSAAGLRLARAGRAASPALFSLVSVGLLLVFGCAMAQIGVVGFATAHKAPSQSGLLLAVWSLGAITGGLFVGTRVNAAGEAGLLGALGASGAGLLLVIAAPDIAILYPLIFVAGLGLVPALGAMYNLAGKLAPAAGAVEAFGWLSGGTQTGIAGGSALGGVVLQHFGTRTTFAAAAATVFASAAVILLTKGQLAHARLRAGAAS